MLPAQLLLKDPSISLLDDQVKFRLELGIEVVLKRVSIQM